MSELRKAAQQALEFIKTTNASSQFWLVPESNLNKTVNALRAALAQPEQEPVAFAFYWPPTNTLRRNPAYQLACVPTTAWKDEIPLYTAPPQRKPLRRGVNGVCTRRSCECEREGLGDQCIWLEPIEKAHGIGGEE